MSGFDFDGIEDADIFERGKYLNPGFEYGLEVQKILVKDTRKSGKAFIVEFKVLESNDPDTKVGVKRTWFQKMIDKDIAFPAIKEFMAALLGYAPQDKERWDRFNKLISPTLKAAIKEYENIEDSPLFGTTVWVETSSKLTKEKQQDFTVHDWKTWSPDGDDD